MEPRLSVHEMRRRAPLHYWFKADNARFAAYALWTFDKGLQKRCAEQIGYSGGTTIAMNEAFFREAALSLELAIKAVIAQRIELGLSKRDVIRVRPTHDLVSLWSDAELPRLPPDDLHRLMIAREGLYWSARYAAPVKDEDYTRRQKEMAPLEERVGSGRLKVIKVRSFAWDDFDRIYKIAAGSFAELSGDGPG